MSPAEGREGGALRLLLVALVVLFCALGGRLASVRFNDVPHGDVLTSVAAAESLARDGELTLPFVLFATQPRPTDALSTPLAYRAPLWPLLAAGLVSIAGDGYSAVRALSLLAGAVFLGMAWLAFRRLFGSATAVVSVLWLGFSYLFIDFSGNGSLYLTLATLFLAAAFILARLEGWWRAAALGLVLGTAQLLHHSAVVLWGAVMLYPVVARLLKQPTRWKLVAAALTVAVLCQVPWLVRNLRLFGDPLYQENTVYFLYKLGVPWQLVSGERGVWIEFDTAAMPWAERGRRILWWTLGNGWYLVRKALVLVPVFALFALHGLRDRVRCREDALAVYGLVGPALLFVGLTVLWPVVKFRTFTVWLPVLVAFGVHGVRALRRRGWRIGLTAAGLAGVVALSIATFLAVPSHTYYYDGAVTRDAFGLRGEEVYVAEQRELHELLARLAEAPPRPIYASEIHVHYYTGFPVVQLIAPADAAALRDIARRYRVGYVVCRSEESQRLARVLNAKELAASQTFVLLALDPPG